DALPILSAEVSSIRLRLDLKADISLNLKSITCPEKLPTFATRQLNRQPTTDNRHDLFLVRTELILTRADHAHGGRQFCALKGNRLNFSVEVFVYVQHSCHS